MNEFAENPWVKLFLWFPSLVALIWKILVWVYWKILFVLWEKLKEVDWTWIKKESVFFILALIFMIIQTYLIKKNDFFFVEDEDIGNKYKSLKINRSFPPKPHQTREHHSA
jgi:hypothetical protein